jgi:hypothetical protein
MDLITIILIAGAFYVGWVVRGAVILNNLSEDPDRIIRILEDIKKINDAEAAGIKGEDALALVNSTKVRAEVVGDVFYLYGLEDNEFISQGSSIEDAVKLAQKRFPNKNFWLEKQNISSQTA